MTGNRSGPIVLVIAMENERTHLEGLIPGWRHSLEGGWPIMRTLHHEAQLIVIRCGIGMVAAAAATEYAVTCWNPRCILNFGCAGAHTRDLLPGDVVIGSELVHHGRMRISTDNGIVPLDSPFNVAGELDTGRGLSSSPKLVTVAQDAAAQTALEAWPEDLRIPLHNSEGTVRVQTGVVASADVWIQDPAWLDQIHRRTGSLCEDMEAAAIAQIAALHGVPFLTIKDISNNEFHVTSMFDGTESALPVSEVGKRAAALTVATIDRLIAS